MSDDSLKKRVEAYVEIIVEWCLPIEPRLQDEPQAYKAALLRLGAMMALSPKGPRDDFLSVLAAKDAEIERLRTALKPFADAGEQLDEDDPKRGEIWEHPAAMMIDFRDLHDAAAAYREPTE